MVSHHPAKFTDHRHCASGDTMFYIYHVTSSNNVFKGLCNCIGGNP